MIGKKRILVNILARSGSTSIKDKNIAILDGKPVLWYSVTEALKSKYADAVCFSTDSRKYANLAEEAGAKVPFLRDPRYARKNSTAAAASRWTTLRYEKYSKLKYDYIVDFMNSNPFKIVDDLDSCIEMLYENIRADTVVAVNRVWDGHPDRIKQIINGEIQDWPGTKEKLESMRQNLTPPAYIRSGSVYAMKRHVLIDEVNRRGKVSIPYILPDERVCNLDELKDLYAARAMIDLRKKNNLIKKRFNYRILCTSKLKDLDEVIEILQRVGTIDFEENITRNKLKEIIHKYEIIFVSTNISIDKSLLGKFNKTKIKYIVTPSVGTDHLDITYLKKKDIKVISLFHEYELTKYIYSPAELTFTHLLNISRNFVQSLISVKKSKWNPNNFIGNELFGKTIGIIGMGSVGTMMSNYCKAFGMKILCYDPYKIISDSDIKQTNNINYLLRNSDVVSLHVNLTKKTKYMISFNEFEIMKKTCIFINCSRGEVVDTLALISSLRENKIRAAGIDVIENETGKNKKISSKKIKDNLKYLQKNNKLFITPHIGGSTIEGRIKRSKFVSNLLLKSLEEKN